ncbi:MAG: hypothetical protein WCH63_00620 [Actinomycetota bacterium]
MIFKTTVRSNSFDECVHGNEKLATQFEIKKSLKKSLKMFTLFSCLVLLVSACSETPRTATNFCRQLAIEAPAIGYPPVTAADVAAMLARYERLSKTAPLVIEDEWKSLTELLAVASRVKSNDPESVQAVIEMAYSTEKESATVAKWTRETCGIDISNGLKVAPTS